MQRSPISQAAAGARFIGAVFGIVFFGIGLTVLVFMWTASFGEFGSPPLFFRIFASFIAIAFVAVGGTIAASSIFGGKMMSMVASPDATATTSSPSPQTGYVCPNCGASLGEKADVSPLGDAKCPFCGTWFNIHGRR